MPIALDNPEAYTVAPSAGFVPDRLGVRQVRISVDRATGAYAVALTPCPATADRWGPADAAEVSTPDLIAELLAAPNSAGKLAAIQAAQRITADLVTVAGFLIGLRS